MQLLLSFLNINQKKRQISRLNRNYSSLINLWQRSVYKSYSVWFYGVRQLRQVQAGIRVMSRGGSVEGQGLTDCGELRRLLNSFFFFFFFSFFLWNNQETISYYLSQELLWRIPKMFFVMTLTLIFASIFTQSPEKNSMMCKSASVWTHCIS